jgi:predicted MFS family arabinose efflux permease
MNATPARPSLAQNRAILRQGLRASVAEGVLATPVVTMSLPVNIFMTALVAKGFPLSKPDIGGASSLPFACNFLQVFITPLVTRRARARPTAIIAAALHTGCWAWLGWKLPFLSPADPVATGRVLLLWVFIASLFNAVLSVVWNGWMHEIVPARLRGRYFGQRNRLIQGATLAFVLGTGCALSWGGYSARTFQAIIAVACLCRVASLFYFARMPDRGPQTHAPGPATLPLREQVAVVRRSHSLLLFIAFGAVWNFASNCFGPFYHVFMFEQLDFSGLQVGLLATLTALGGIISLPIWGGLLDRYGNKACMAVALGLWQGPNFLWCFLTPGNSAILYGMWFWGGALSAGFILGQFTILLKLIPAEARSLAIGLNLAVTSIVAAVSPIIGGEVLARLFAQGYAPLDVYHVVFLLQPAVSLLGCILLLRIEEPASSPLGSVVGAMRNIRTLSGVLGLSFFVNYLFVRPADADSRRRLK